DSSTAEMQATLLSLGSQLEAHRMRLAEIERRAQTPKEALAPSVAKSALVNTSVAESQGDRPSAPPITAPFQPPSMPAPTESKMAIITASTGRVDALQSEIDQLTRQLHALRAMTPGRAPAGEDSKSLTLKRPEPSTPSAGKLSETRLPVTSRETNLDSVSPAPATAVRSYDAPASAPPSPPSNGNGKAPPQETEEAMSLEMIKGIGSGYAARLQAAGITTIRDLANATPGQLEAIIKAPKWRQPDYTTWIRSARMIVRGVK
ncbi:MAG: hypothetical protein M1546_01415, partial [Chloroflexi bacterium]|nr:hypothetical protein [Chloroflexota bacterium]